MPEAQAEAANETRWEDRIWSIAKQIGIFLAIQYAVRSFIGGKQPANPAPAPRMNGDDALSQTGTESSYSEIPHLVYPLWPDNTTVDVSLYISPSIAMPRLSSMPQESLIVNEKGFALDSSRKDHREIQTEFAVPRNVQENGTLWAHIYVGQTGAELDPTSPAYDPSRAYNMLRPLTQYLGRKKVKKTRNLLEAKDATFVEEEEAEDLSPTVASYYHPNFTLAFVPGAGSPNYATLHPAVRQFHVLEQTGARDESGKNGYYYPVLYHNTFWQLKAHMIELNATLPIPTLPLNVDITTLNYWAFFAMSAMDEGMKETARKSALGESTPGGGDGSEMELIKETLIDTNPWLLGTTAVVSILHMLFELLAFKSDVGHWRSKKDNVGVSVRTIFSNVIMQTIILLYLVDNNDNTSYMILFGQAMGIAIEAWKITKIANVRLRAPAPGSWPATLGLPYTVTLEDNHTLSTTEAETEEYDRIAFRYMTYLAIPLLAAYAVYSLLYTPHKSWYSFIITTLVGSVYAYGFLLMVPSLYINYRLQSVAHLPGKAMTYKFLNTFIDDLFAFTVKMPVLHRLATLRDDVVFLVYIYQMWAYRVDYGRVNEFGQGGEAEGESEDKAKVVEVAEGADASKADEKVRAVGSGARGASGASGASGKGSGKNSTRRRKG
ncbi:hypothetical protein B0A50_06906 [Salinomyces thailandicus]|uniref:Cleft lip and palate transmembrane protein 1 n=1 Tax=Salinomyces thailandicus TaxID=706561 RepID=A0A4U0TQI4_9PEZI|nr:hypothetical protein B0A50_06906 [Salinomyces thailandica]